MTSLQDVPLAKEPAPAVAGPDSALRLIGVAVGWFLLSSAIPFAVTFLQSFAQGFVRGLTNGASQLEIPATLSHLFNSVGLLGAGIVLLYAASIRGRIVGNGDRRLGLGVAPVESLPIVVVLSIAAVLYAAAITFATYTYRPDLFFQSSSVPVWLVLFDSLLLVVLTPLSEELFFRGWLWTGLQRHWGALPAALVTAIMWLLPHFGYGRARVYILLVPALILTLARQVGRSVRPTIFIHALYNLITNYPHIALLVKLFKP